MVMMQYFGEYVYKDVIAMAFLGQIPKAHRVALVSKSALALNIIDINKSEGKLLIIHWQGKSG